MNIISRVSEVLHHGAVILAVTVILVLVLPSP
jgi:hypothetical protein